MILGIDEAGKGPVIGSMFIAGICATKNEILYLKTLGIKDSKKLSSKTRNDLYNKITTKISSYYVLEVSASLIDELRTIMTMNEIMVLCFSNVIYHLKEYHSNIIIIDAADISESRFKNNIIQHLKKQNLEHILQDVLLISKHKADLKYLIVSTASIIAKIERDKMINNFNNELKIDAGSGYPSDLKTINFLKTHNFMNSPYNIYIRKSWKTIKNILSK